MCSTSVLGQSIRSGRPIKDVMMSSSIDMSVVHYIILLLEGKHSTHFSIELLLVSTTLALSRQTRLSRKC